MKSKKIPSWLLALIAGAFLPSLLRSLWLVFVEGVDWSTQTWIIIVVVAFAWGLVAATVAWVAIPVRIRTTLDRFMFGLASRMDTFEGSISDRILELHTILNQRLEAKEIAQVEDEERSLATISMLLVPYMVATDKVAPGHCPICKASIPNWADRPQGHHDLYRSRDHGRLEDGTPCPVPFMYYLSSRRKQAELKPIARIARP